MNTSDKIGINVVSNMGENNKGFFTMSKTKVVVLDSLSDIQLIELSNSHDVVVLDSSIAETDYEKFNNIFMHELKDTHGLIVSKMRITNAILDAAPELRVISSVSAGYNNYPMPELNKRGILLCNTPDVLTETTADIGFLLIMATARRAIELANFVKEGKWVGDLDEVYFGTDVHGKTLGIIGMGRIGAAIARRGALGFGMKVIYSVSSSKPALELELGAKKVELDDLLQQSDFVCITVPLSSETYHLIGKRELEKMSSHSILINISRGSVVDEDALIECLQKDGIRGAGLDVFKYEPLPNDSPLMRMVQVVALPHVGSATHDTRRAMAQRALENILLSLKGKSPLSAINESHWTRK